MKNLISSVILFLLLSGSGYANQINKEEVIYTTPDGVVCKGYIAYKANAKSLPVVLIVHEWWGCNDYAHMRADMLADIGYFAFAVDMYGEGQLAEDPDEAGKLAGVFYSNPKLVLDRLEGVQNKLSDFNVADKNNIAAIGYCFGGSMVLNAIKMGVSFKGVVSFHGGLKGVPAPDGLKGKILVCHGNKDSFVPEEDVNSFKEDMDKHKVDYSFIGYEEATHAFTNPMSTENGQKFNLPIAYNEEADKRSWEDMQAFLKTVFN